MYPSVHSLSHKTTAGIHSPSGAFQLFQTLANNPSLCTYLRRLELRVWPLATNDPHREALERQVLIVLHHAENLKRLDFTRRGSMTDKMFAVVAERSKWVKATSKG